MGQRPNFNEWLRRAAAVKRRIANVAVKRCPVLNWAGVVGSHTQYRGPARRYVGTLGDDMLQSRSGCSWSGKRSLARNR
jgi:hypothetical protein